MAYSRYVANWHDLPTQDTPIDATFLQRVEDALVTLFGVAPSTNGALIWDGSQFTAANKIKDAQIDSIAGISFSKINTTAQITDADVAAGANIAASKIAGGLNAARSDVFANRGVASTYANQFFYATDTHVLYLSDGSSWTNMTPTQLVQKAANLGTLGNGSTGTITAPAAGTYIVGFGMGAHGSLSLGDYSSLTTDVTGSHTATGGTTGGSGGSVYVPGITLTNGQTITVTCTSISSSTAVDAWILLIQTA